MVRCALACEGECSLWTLVLQGSQRQGRSHVGIAFARDKRRQHAPACDPKEIGDDAAKLESLSEKWSAWYYGGPLGT